jgi:FKBP-type peptidyl-prolyl cis-trans isomerase FkpA
MKKYFAVSLLAASIMAVSGCQEKVDTPAAAQVQLENDAQKQAYAIGASVSLYIARTLDQQKILGVELDKSIILKGMQAGLSGEVQMSDEDVKATLQGLDEQLSDLANAKAEEDAKVSKAQSEKFLQDNAKREGVTVTDSGLQFEVVEAGKGAKPAVDDIVTVHYTGSLSDGTVFDSSVERGEPATFSLGQVIPGWTEGLQLMSVGAKYKLYIPSDLAYGEEGAGQSIPPNAALVFDVELLSIGEPKTENAGG